MGSFVKHESIMLKKMIIVTRIIIRKIYYICSNRITHIQIKHRNKIIKIKTFLQNDIKTKNAT